MLENTIIVYGILNGVAILLAAGISSISDNEGGWTIKWRKITYLQIFTFCLVPSILIGYFLGIAIYNFFKWLNQPVLRDRD